MAHCRTTTLIPIFLLLTIILTIYMMSHETAPSVPRIPTDTASTPKPLEPGISPYPPPSYRIIYNPVPDLFLQSLSTTNATAFDPLNSSLGLLPRTYPTDSSLPSGTGPWLRFTHYLMTLNADSPLTTSYKLLLLSRHGEGLHNVAESFFGTVAWDCFFAGLDGSQNVTWADAELTARGVGQAKEMGEGYARLVRGEGVLLPERWYVSPLRRAVRTATGTWSVVMKEVGEEGKEVRPIVMENLREGMGIHTCDRRSRRSEIEDEFPALEFEEGFPEEDELWVPDLREPGEAQDVRVRRALDEISRKDRSLGISVTSHGGTIASILRVVGHRDFVVPTGGLLPMVVKVEFVDEERPREREVEWERGPECVGGKPGEEEVERLLRGFDESLEGKL